MYLVFETEPICKSLYVCMYIDSECVGNSVWVPVRIHRAAVAKMRHISIPARTLTMAMLPTCKKYVVYSY